MTDALFTPISIADGFKKSGYSQSNKGGTGNLLTLQFPSDLGVSANESSPQQSHYMVIYINEIKAGNFGKETVDDVKSGDVPVFMESGSSHQSKQISDVIKNAKSYSQSTDQWAACNPSLVNTASAAAVTGVTDTLTGIYDVAAAEIKRTAITVCLPMPEQLNSSYDMNWSADNNEIIGNIAGLANRQSGEGLGSSILKMMAARIGGSAVQNVTQKAVNPRTQMLFSGMNFRNFTWTWTLYPRNQEEAKALWDITEFLKYHALPEYDAASGGVFLIQPSLFDIEFHSFGKRNDWLTKTLTCVCRNITVDYAPAGVVAFFEPYVDPVSQQTVSAPIGIRLSMSFEETEILTKNRVNGYNREKYDFNQGMGVTEGTY